jgi:RNA-directed DNA polymerase
MARGRGVYWRITEPDNLRLAFTKAIKGKSDRCEALAFRADLDNNLAALREELLTGDVMLGNYHFFKVFDPKERTICAAPFRERVLHHAVMNICEPTLEQYSIYDSYACRAGKGLHRALARSHAFAGRFPWYLKLDIRKYFDSIDHEILLALLSRRFHDQRLRKLFALALGSYETASGKGLPIGNLLSQHFANFYLGLMDHWLKEVRNVTGYLRYMDDFIIFGWSREELKSALHSVENFLGEHVKLELNNAQQLNRTAQGMPFLGFRVFPEVIRLSPRCRRRFVDKLHYYELEAVEGRMSESELARRVLSLVAFTKTADAAGFRNGVLARQGV